MAENLDIEVRDGGSAKRVAKDVRDIGPAALAADKGVQVLNLAFSRMGAMVAAAAAAIFTAQAALKGLDVADNIRDKLSLVEPTIGAVNERIKELGQVADRTGSQVQNTTGLYTSLSQALSGAGISTQRVLGLTESLERAMITQGKATGEGAGVMQRFVAQLQQGELSGRGLTSVLIQIPEITNALAVGLGITTEQLVEMGRQGQLSTQMVIQGLERSAGFIESRWKIAVGGLPESFNRVTNALVDLADKSGLIDLVTLALDKLASTVRFLTELVIVFKKEVLGIGDAADEAGTKLDNQMDKIARATQTGVKSMDQLQAETDALNKKFGILGDTGEGAMEQVRRSTDRATSSMEAYNATTAQATAITTGFDASVRSLEAAASAAADQVNNLAASQTKLSAASAGAAGGGGTGGGRGGGGGGGGEALGTGFAESLRALELGQFDQSLNELRLQMQELNFSMLKAEREGQTGKLEMIRKKLDDLAFQQARIELQRARIEAKPLETGVSIQDIFAVGQGQPRFQHGGSFTVGGSGSPDSRLIKFWATPGEDVTIRTRRQQREAEQVDGGTINNNFNMPITIVTPDIEGFKRSRTQVRTELLNELEAVKRKSGIA